MLKTGSLVHLLRSFLAAETQFSSERVPDRVFHRFPVHYLLDYPFHKAERALRRRLATVKVSLFILLIRKLKETL